MQHLSHTIEFLSFDSAEELPPDDFALLQAAREFTAGSYAPYSRYHVGAALRLAGGTIVPGSNQENMSFPAGLCAERVALFAAAAAHPGVAVEAIAITARSDRFPVNEPVPPCGICRQAVAEYEMKSGLPIRIILAGATGKAYVFRSMGNLLPFTFKETGLVKS